MRDATGTSTGEDFVAWAEQALVDGRDSPALRQLAGLNRPTRSDAKPLFDRAVFELGLRLPATEAALRRAYLDILAADILSGARGPGDALEVIHSEVLEPLKHPDDLMAWCFLWEHLDPERGFASLTDAERDEAARQLARRMLQKDGGQSRTSGS